MQDTLRTELDKYPVRTGETRAGLALLWCLAVLVFGVGDLLTSSLAMGLGAVEGNGIVRELIGPRGENIWLLTILKSALLSTLLALSYLKLGKYAWLVPAVLICAGGYMLLHNLAVLLFLLKGLI